MMIECLIVKKNLFFGVVVVGQMSGARYALRDL